MARIQVNPNRMELLKLRKRAAIAERGHKLLKDKLDELMKQFLALVQESRELRREVEARLADAHLIFAIARSEVITEEVEESLSVPTMSLEVEVEQANIMGVRVPHFEVRMEGEFDCYSLISTPFSLDAALLNYRDLTPDLVRLAEMENNVSLLAQEIERTRRRVNALEHVLIPSLKETIVYITMKLDEMERSYRTQLMKIKSMQEEAASR
ncbi:V-type ATP synthase subunit D [Candidatus Solincola sp.]|nr:V-type ATP synthase subunit D [Actinomycetota bacterium]MDI7251766.1 V-type ATP synthase subunit D [Actinomycetota bacterium]